MKAYSHILASKKQKRKLFSVLIDPDKQDKHSLLKTIKTAESAKVDFFFLSKNHNTQICKENSALLIVPAETRLSVYRRL